MTQECHQRLQFHVKELVFFHHLPEIPKSHAKRLLQEPVESVLFRSQPNGQAIGNQQILLQMLDAYLLNGIELKHGSGGQDSLHISIVDGDLFGVAKCDQSLQNVSGNSDCENLMAFGVSGQGCGQWRTE